MDISKLNVAIVYDRLNKWGGAERVLLALHKIFPRACLVTSVYDSVNALWAKVFPCVRASFLQNLPFIRSRHQSFSWLMPLAFESLNFDEYDLVISVTSEFAKGILTKPETKHLCYLLTPTRYLWSHYDIYFMNELFKFVSKPLVSYLRYYDKVISFRPDKIISISREVKKRVKKYYRLDSSLVYPPLYFGKDDSAFLNSFNYKDFGFKDYYLLVSRLEPYKRVDLVVEAFNILKENLVIVGKGSQENFLKNKASSNVKFMGQLNDKDLAFYYQNAKALIMPQYEDFGLVSLEAQSYFIPVIAYRKGGACETVVEGKTGIFFDHQDTYSLIDAIYKFAKMNFSRNDFKENLDRFSFNRFKESFLSEVLDLFEK